MALFREKELTRMPPHVVIPVAVPVEEDAVEVAAAHPCRSFDLAENLLDGGNVFPW